jgi:NADPH2:quinone reductase
MHAAFITTTGSPDVIQVGEVPTPTPAAGQVLVQVGASAVNPIDTYIRAGVVAMPLPTPFIPGCDLAGTVTAVGPGVHRVQVGQRVWGSNQGLFGRQGTLAEFACVAEDWLYPTPDNLTDPEAAALALVGITAHLGLFRAARLEAGETVFVNGGTGGVGSAVVQCAKAVGARVITTVGSAEKAELAARLGADVVLNYRTDDVPAGIKDATAGKGVQVWYETQREPDLLRTVPLMALRGRLIVMAGRAALPVFPVGPFYTRDLSLHGFAMFNASADEQRTCANDLNEWLTAGKLKPLIGRLFPLAAAAEAHRLQEENTLNKAGTLTGKIVVTP